MKATRLSLIGALALAGAAYGQQPPDVVMSDSSDNTAMGTDALFRLTPNNSPPDSGSGNTASGAYTLYSNTTGSYNTASGLIALSVNTTGHENTASGAYTLIHNTTGYSNTASGALALQQNRTGYYNTASGASALVLNETGNNNTASGAFALLSNTTGDNNIAEGYLAGQFLTTGSNNIDIGNQGAAGDTNTIRIGTQGTQAATYVAGIWGHHVRGRRPVFVNDQGELGVGDEDARSDGVRYDELPPMLLKELQTQAAEIRALKRQQMQFVAQAKQLRHVQQQLTELHAELAKLQSKDQLVAQR